MTLPCAGRTDVYDVLIDQTGGHQHRAALNEARRLCLGIKNDADSPPCPYAAQCLAPAAKSGELWAKSVLGRYAHTGKVAQCGTDSGYSRHARVLHEPACPACKRAHRDAERARVEARRGAA